MTKEEVIIIINRIKVNFNSNLPDNWDELKKEWANMLLSKDFKLVTDNLNEYLENNFYFPKFVHLVKDSSGSKKAGPYIPNAEETQDYINKLKEYEKGACSKDKALEYIQKMKRMLENEH